MNRKRIYSSLFHLHTVCGIIISAVLFIIFYCGVFALFKDEIKIWELSTSPVVEKSDVDLEQLLDLLGSEYNLVGRNILFNLSHDSDLIYIYLSGSSLDDANVDDLEPYGLYTAKDTGVFKNYEESYTYSEFIYRLHFLSQIPYIGAYIAGIVSVMFLLALITGIYIHWDKMVKNLFLFRPQTNWKTIWTDAHTVLGTIGLPFQLIFALTGAFFCLSVLVLLPASALYNNDIDKLTNDLLPMNAQDKWENLSNVEPLSLNAFINDKKNIWSDFEVNQVSIVNYGGTNMEYQLFGQRTHDVAFIGDGMLSANAYTYKTTKKINPNQKNYITDVKSVMYRLHFGDYGGYLIRFIYSALSLLTCFVIISGVMIWLTARKKKNVSQKQQNFNYKVANIYLGICLSLIPITAFGFILSKILPFHYSGDRQLYYYLTFFISWAILSIYFIKKKNLQYTNACNLFIGGILFLILPILNGFLSGNWIWVSISNGFDALYMLDLFFFFLGSLSLYAFYILRKKENHNLK